MRFGDLSNEPALKVGVRFEEILRRERDGALNRTGKAFLEQLGNLDTQTVVLTTGDERKAQAFCYKWGISYSHVQAVDSILDLENVCRELGMVTYYDTDKELLQRIRSRGKQPLETILWTTQHNLYLVS